MHRFVSGLSFLLFIFLPFAQGLADPREQRIPILGTTTEQQPTGSVAYVIASFEERTDRRGLIIRFHSTPGRFSTMAKESIEQAIRRTARSLNLPTDNWSIDLSVPYEGVTIYGNSLSAMVGLSVAAMAQGKTVPTGYVLTGTVTAEGEIGPVGSVPLKIQAAKAAELRRVFVPKQKETDERDASSPSTIEVSPVRSIAEAFDALTNSDHFK